MNCKKCQEKIEKTGKLCPWRSISGDYCDKIDNFPSKSEGEVVIPINLKFTKPRQRTPAEKSCLKCEYLQINNLGYYCPHEQIQMRFHAHDVKYDPPYDNCTYYQLSPKHNFKCPKCQREMEIRTCPICECTTSPELPF